MSRWPLVLLVLCLTAVWAHSEDGGEAPPEVIESPYVINLNAENFDEYE